MRDTNEQASPAIRMLTTTHADTTPAAPGHLELVRGFLSLHDHATGTRDSLAPSLGTIAWWLGERGLIPSESRPSEEDLGWAASVLDALRTQVDENMGSPPEDAAIRTLDDAARETGLAVDFGSGELRPEAGGVKGAIGRILAVAFVSQLDGSWTRFKGCSSPVCRAVFWDRSKNRSGRWCAMKDCGNRAKVRAYRERERRKA